jgi:hypothetical protein
MPNTPEGYKPVLATDELGAALAGDSDPEHRALTRAAIERYRPLGWTIYVARDSWAGVQSAAGHGKTKARNADVIVLGSTAACAFYLVLIECKSGSSGVSAAVMQLEVTARAVVAAGLIPAALTPEQLAGCFHPVVFVTHKFKETLALVRTPGNEINVGGGSKFAELVAVAAALPPV